MARGPEDAGDHTEGLTQRPAGDDGRQSRLVAARRVHGHRELHDIAALHFRDFAGALLFHLIDAHDRVHGEKSGFDAGKFRLELFLRRVDDNRAALIKDQMADLHEAEQCAVCDMARVNLVNLPLVQENDLVNLLI